MSCSTCGPWPVKSTDRLTRRTPCQPGRGVARARASVRWASASRCSPTVPCRCRAPSRDVTRPAWREPRQRVRDGRSLGTDEPPEQAVRQRERETDSARLDVAPTSGEMPEEQREPDLEARLRRDRALDVQVGGARTRAVQQRARDLRPRLDPLGERVVEQGDARRHERMPRRVALEHVVGARRSRGCSTSPSPTISVAVRSPTWTSTLSAPSTTSRPGPCADRSEAPRRDRSRLRASRTRRP